MNARKITFSLALLSLTASTAMAATSFMGCGGTNANPSPDASFPHDSSSHTDAPMKNDGGGGGKDTGGGGMDTGGGGMDVGLPDTGSCKSDSSACNTCYTDAQAAADPLNSCSTYTKNCVTFDPSRVPSHPTL